MPDFRIYKIVPDQLMSGMRAYVLGSGITANCKVVIGSAVIDTTLETDDIMLSFVVPSSFLYGNLAVRKTIVGGTTDSNDLKVTQVFSWTDSIVGGTTSVKGLYVDELRTNLNGKLMAAGKPTMKFKYPSPLSGHPIKWPRCMYELRYAVNRYIVPPVTFTDTSLHNIYPKAAHVKELRIAINGANFAPEIANPTDPEIQSRWEEEYGFVIADAGNKLSTDPLYQAWLASVQPA